MVYGFGIGILLALIIYMVTGIMMDQSEIGAVSAGTQQYMDGDYGSRTRNPTDKGRAYFLALRYKKRISMSRELSRQTDIMMSLMGNEMTDLRSMRLAFSQWMLVYEDFLNSHYHYQQLLSPDEQYNDNQDWFFPQDELYRRVKVKARNWIQKEESEAQILIAANVKDADNISQFTGVSQQYSRKSHFSNASSQASSLAMAKAIEDQKSAELQARAARLKKKLAIEQELLRLKIEEEQFEIETELAISDARKKVLTELETELEQRSLRHSDVNFQGESHIVGKTGSEQIYRYVSQNCTESYNSNVSLNKSATSDVNQGKADLAQHANRNACNNLAAPQIGNNNYERNYNKGRLGDSDYLSSGASSGSSRVSGIKEVVRELRKPQCEIKKFAGNCMDYKRFIRQFSTKVLSITTDMEERMNYLEQYTVGEANRIVTGYSYLDAEQGYQAAMKELEDRYGDPNMIANAYLKRAREWPNIKADDPRALDEFAIFLRECEHATRSINALQTMEFPDHMKILIQKLPFHLHDKWRGKVHDARHAKRQITFKLLVDFVKAEAKKVNDPMYGKTAMHADVTTSKNPRYRTQSGKVRRSFATNVLGVSENSNSQVRSEVSHDQSRRLCLYCKDTHSLVDCGKLFREPKDIRLNFLKSKGLCFGCLKSGHFGRNCRNRAVCRYCKARHPTLLHMNGSEFKSVDCQKTESESRDESHKATCTSACASFGADSNGPMGAGNSECTMAIIPVLVKPKNGTTALETYAFLDPGSNVSFCTVDLMNKLGMSGIKSKITIDTMGVPHTMDTYILKNLEVGDLDGTNMISIPTVYTKPRMPVSTRHKATVDDISKWSHLEGIPMPEIKAEVGLLIGNGVPDAYAPLEVITGPSGSPHASRTRLGWITWNVVRQTGESNNGGQNGFLVNHAEVVAIEEVEQLKQLDRMVRGAINMDFPERSIDDRRELSQEDKAFTKLVEDSMQHRDGHYEIGLPFRNKDEQLPNNQFYARQRLKGLEKRMRNDDKFAADYTAFMTDIIDKKYAVHVPDEKMDRQDGRVWYIPHHGIYHPKKPNKIRVVFDCSAKWLGISLNDLLLQGPDLTNSLFGVLLRFRQEPIALMADIEAMFHQVKVPEEDMDCLRFYWWPNGDVSREPQVYRMAVHLFGAISSPSCSNTALRQTALDNKGSFSMEVVNTVLRDFYVDDCLTSCGTEKRAISMVQNLIDICSKGGFNLTKWVSNSHSVLESIPIDKRAKEVKQLDLSYDSIPMQRALGVYWHVESDRLGFDINLGEKPSTRRGILSIVSSVYDPIGLAAPFVLPGKLLLQDLCHRGIGWDDEIGKMDQQRWRSWEADLPRLKEIMVPRCYKPLDFGKVVSCQIHNFSDASEKGYGCVSYLRLVNDTGLVHCSLLAGKSRVAPLKKITIPRMELTAATLSVRMNKLIIQELDYDIDESFFWTDSQAVIRYCANKTTRFHTFVANRLNVIHEGSDISQWKYVGSKYNPADYASRGLRVDNVEARERWLRGPDFLWRSELWAGDDMSFQIPDDDPEMKIVVNSAVHDESQVGVDRLLSYFSDWVKLKVTVAWFLRAKSNLKFWASERRRLRLELNESISDGVELDKVVDSKMKILKETGLADSKHMERKQITVDELQKAEYAILSYVQGQYFDKEIASLESKQATVKRSSSLYKLDPQLKGGLIRVGGRLSRSRLPDSSKHPIILPKESSVSDMIIRHTHKLVGHLGRNSVLSKLRQSYWILCANSAVRRLVKKCIICSRYRAKLGQQKMADLPTERLLPDNPPFTHTGIDYFGPLEVKRGRSVVKRYGVIFTCMNSRAVHLEVAHSLDTDSCINVLRRFKARRGTVKLMRSDNGTNLVGAKRELQEQIDKWNHSKIGSVLRQHNIEWRFNPPSGSHFGGIWERHIRTVRKILYALFREQSVYLDDEALCTFLCEVESILNARPISVVSEDHNDLEALTPNHILLLQPNNSLPPGVFDKCDNYAKRRWRQVQYLANVFWRRWLREYLPLLQERQKWLQVSTNLSVGDIVLVVDTSTPRNTWPMGRVVEVMKDRKGLVRMGRVQTKGNVLLRPVDKLCTLLEADTYVDKDVKGKLESA